MRGLLLGIVALALAAAGTVAAAPVAGAQATSPHFDLMIQQQLNGGTHHCADLRYAAGQGLVTPSEALFLEDHDVGSCGNRNYVLVLALGGQHALTCGDVEWNAAAGYLDWAQASEALGFVPGCGLSGYATLVAIAASKDLACPDITWWEGRGSITAIQGVWLRELVASLQGAPCQVNVAPPPPPTAGPPAVAFAVTSGAFCSQADAGKWGYTATGALLQCKPSPTDLRLRWRQA